MNLLQQRTYLEQSVGAAVLWLQPLEEGLKAVLTYLFKDPAGIDPTDPYKWLAKKRTLGLLVAELKTRVKVPEHFDEILKQFIEDRNVLIHRFFENYNLYDPQSYDDAIKMIHRLRQNIEVINDVLNAMFTDPMSALKFE